MHQKSNKEVLKKIFDIVRKIERIQVISNVVNSGDLGFSTISNMIYIWSIKDSVWPSIATKFQTNIIFCSQKHHLKQVFWLDWFWTYGLSKMALNLISFGYFGRIDFKSLIFVSRLDFVLIKVFGWICYLWDICVTFDLLFCLEYLG